MADQMKGRSATPKVNRVKSKSPRSLTGTKPGAPSPRPTNTKGGVKKLGPKQREAMSKAFRPDIKSRKGAGGKMMT